MGAANTLLTAPYRFLSLYYQPILASSAAICCCSS